jgi:hypothetical protein
MTPQDPHALVKEVRDGLAEREGWALELVDYSDYDPVPNAPKLRALELIARHLTEARITDQGGEGNVAEFCCADDARAVLKSRVDLTRLCAALERVTRERDEAVSTMDAARAYAKDPADKQAEAVNLIVKLYEQRDQALAAHRAMADALTRANERADRLHQECADRAECEQSLSAMLLEANERADSLDRQRPTHWAYQQACRALEKHRERADRLTSAADRMAGDLQDRKGCVSCPLGGDDCDGCAVLAWRETRGDG